MRILIADDDEAGCEPLCASLEVDGHVVTHAFDGEAALELLLSERFDVAIFDLDMPRKDGASVVRELRERSIELPIILASGNGNVKRVARELGVSHALLKPFGLDELKMALRELASGSPEAESWEDATPSSRFPSHEVSTHVRLRYRVPPTGKVENDR